jgi:hypothetical protein
MVERENFVNQGEKEIGKPKRERIWLAKETYRRRERMVRYDA